MSSHAPKAAPLCLTSNRRLAKSQLLASIINARVDHLAMDAASFVPARSLATLNLKWTPPSWSTC